MRERGDRGVAIALLLENHAEIEIGGDEIRAKRERALIRARGVGIAPLHLQRHAVVVMRLAVERLARERRLEQRRRARAVVGGKPSRAPRAQEPRCGIGRALRALPAERLGLVQRTRVDRGADRRDARVDVVRRHRERRGKMSARLVGLARFAQRAPIRKCAGENSG